MGSLAKKGGEKYMLLLQQHPLKTKAITAGVLTAINDIISQKLAGVKKFQLKPFLLKVFLGVAYLGPFGHYFHLMLEKVFKGKKDTKTTAKKVAIDQLIASPWNNLVFITYYGLFVEGQPWPQVKSKIKKVFPKLQVASWMLGSVLGFVNYKFIPMHFRIFFNSVVGICWGIFMNLRARSAALTKG